MAITHIQVFFVISVVVVILLVWVAVCGHDTVIILSVKRDMMCEGRRLMVLFK